MYITVRVDRPMGQAIGIKEWLAAELERFGDTRIVRISEGACPFARGETQRSGFAAKRRSSEASELSSRCQCSDEEARRCGACDDADDVPDPDQEVMEEWP